ncbi:MAG: Ig-like domain-containing protein [Faecousia sp.]
MDIIELLDGRLYQWDTGRRVALHPLTGQTADEVHFSNNGKDALVVKPALEGSVLVASIPNILLQEAKNVAAYAVMVSDTGERTTYGRNLPVFPRAKPADYAYTETELADYKALEARVAALEKSGGGGGATVVDGAVVSSGSDYAICFEWHDGNPDKEDRRNRFVQLSDGGSKITFATSDADICGVTTDTAAFVENYDIASEHTSLCGILGVVTVIDNGTCTIGGTCMSDDNGYAIPSINNMGYRVMERLDENKIRIAVKPNDDMVQRIKRDMDNKVDFGKQQELSEDQKSQARENIDAASKKDISSLSSKIESIPSAGSGLSIAERTTLIAVVNAIGAFNINNGQELIDNFNAAWGNVVEEIPATGITLSAVSLNFTAGTSQTLTATVEPSDSTDAVIWSSSNPSVATVSNGVVTPVANGDCIITATAGSVSASCSVNVAFAEEVVYYTITKNLKNCTSDNSAESVVEGGGYSATLTADDGYTLDGASVSIVINGEDITDTAYANGVITIQSVTGDVIITVTAVEAGSGDGEEIDVLSNIGFDGTSYLDTEFVPESIYNRYVFGVMTEKTEDSTFKYFAGVSMRDNTSITDSNYIDFIFGTYGGKNGYNSEMPNARFSVSIAGVGPNAICTGADKGDGESSQPYSMPFYISVADGAQALWLDEDCTIAPTAGYFQDISGTVSFSGSQYYSEEKMPVMSMWLGGVRITGIMSNQYKNWGSGVKFYCFKVYDGDGNLIVNMRPAKQGSIIGMWDNVRNKFYPATENGGTVSYEEVA